LRVFFRTLAGGGAATEAITFKDSIVLFFRFGLEAVVDRAADRDGFFGGRVARVRVFVAFFVAMHVTS
jgi:hypothetical protein